HNGPFPFGPAKFVVDQHSACLSVTPIDIVWPFYFCVFPGIGREKIIASQCHCCDKLERLVYAYFSRADQHTKGHVKAFYRLPMFAPLTFPFRLTASATRIARSR